MHTGSPATQRRKSRFLRRSSRGSSWHECMVQGRSALFLSGNIAHAQWLSESPSSPAFGCPFVDPIGTAFHVPAFRPTPPLQGHSWYLQDSGRGSDPEIIDQSQRVSLLLVRVPAAAAQPSELPAHLLVDLLLCLDDCQPCPKSAHRFIPCVCTSVIITARICPGNSGQATVISAKSVSFVLAQITVCSS